MGKLPASTPYQSHKNHKSSRYARASKQALATTFNSAVPINGGVLIKPLVATHQTNRLTTGLIPDLITKLVLSCCLCLSVTACNTLPSEPHTANSLKLNQLLKDRYAEEPIQKNSPFQNSQAQSNQFQSNQAQNSPSQNNETNPLNTTNATETQISKVISQQNETHPNLSGYYPIVTGINAFATRSILTDMATKSIDVQYYIWHNDQAGQLLLERLWKAADRGVIVRFLLDDFNNDAKLDKNLLRFARHPNIAVRLINPMSYRKLQTLNYITDLKRINHRMHNKSMTFDRKLSILGGRNVGDEYLSNSKNSQFADLDVLLIGKVVSDITNSFEDYWQSPLSYDVETLVNDSSAVSNHSPEFKLETTNLEAPTPERQSETVNPETIAHAEYLNKIKHDFIIHLDKLTPEQVRKEGSSIYMRALQKSTISSDLVNKRVPFRWANISFLSDDVGKLTNSADPVTHLVFQLRKVLGKPTKKLTIVSSYFVPTKQGVDTLIKLARNGIKVKILTNSFNATDVAAVHSGYAQWRIPLLKAGIEIYELKAIASEENRENKLWRARSQSSTSLHAKTFAVDDRNVFIGSYNVDPRSANINTELGVVIEDEALAKQLHNAVSDDLLSLAYKVELTVDGHLKWLTREDHQLKTYDKEPNVDITDSVWLKVMSTLPIDWLL